MGLQILLASDFYPPFIGGAELQVQYFATEMARRGHVVDLATVWHAGLPERQDDAGVSVLRLKGWVTRLPWFFTDPKRRFHPPFPDPGIVWGLRRLIRRSRPDLVHANGWIAYSCAAALLGSRVPLVLSVRDYGYTCATRTLLADGQVCAGPELKKCLECATGRYGVPKAVAAVGGVYGGRALLAGKTAATHSVSDFVQGIVRRDLLGRGGLNPDAPSVTIPNVTIPDLVGPHKVGGSAAPTDDGAHLDRLPAEPYILFVGALQLHKGLGPLLEAYASLDDPPPLVLIGSVWPETPREFPPGVTVLRNLPHRSVMVAWERCLFGVAPSVWPDPLPGVVKEAMSKGKPVIGTAIGGIVDMIADGETGLLVRPGDVEGLAKAMARLIADAELRERIGRAARAYATQFTAETVLPRFEALYRQLSPAAMPTR